MNFKKILIPSLQAAVTFLLLYWIFRHPGKREQMLLALRYANLWWLIPGFLSFGIVLIFSAMRWRLLLSVQKIDFGWKRTFHLVMIGMFFNLFLLGSVGGDVLKIFYAMKEVPRKKTGVLLSILLDRLVGMFSLMLVTFAVCFFSLHQLLLNPMTSGIFSTIIVVFGGFILFVLFILISNHFHLWNRLPTWIPAHRSLLDFATALSSYASKTRVLFQATLCSLIMSLFLIGSVIFSAYSFSNIPGSPGAVPMIVVMPIVNTICNIPISLSGIGVRESLFETLLSTLYGTPKSLAVLISLTSFSLIAAWSLLGGLFYLFYSPTSGSYASLDEMEDEVELVEKKVETRAEKIC